MLARLGEQGGAAQFMRTVLAGQGARRALRMHRGKWQAEDHRGLQSIEIESPVVAHEAVLAVRNIVGTPDDRRAGWGPVGLHLRFLSPTGALRKRSCALYLDSQPVSWPSAARWSWPRRG